MKITADHARGPREARPREVLGLSRTRRFKERRLDAARRLHVGVDPLLIQQARRPRLLFKDKGDLQSEGFGDPNGVSVEGQRVGRAPERENGAATRGCKPQGGNDPGSAVLGDEAGIVDDPGLPHPGAGVGQRPREGVDAGASELSHEHKPFILETPDGGSHLGPPDAGGLEEPVQHRLSASRSAARGDDLGQGIEPIPCPSKFSGQTVDNPVSARRLLHQHTRAPKPASLSARTSARGPMGLGRAARNPCLSMTSGGKGSSARDDSTTTAGWSFMRASPVITAAAVAPSWDQSSRRTSG